MYVIHLARFDFQITTWRHFSVLIKSLSVSNCNSIIFEVLVPDDHSLCRHGRVEHSVKDDRLLFQTSSFALLSHFYEKLDD